MATGSPHFFDASRLLSADGFSSSGEVYFYYSGTNVLAPIFTDAAMAIPATNPVPISAGAIVPDKDPVVVPTDFSSSSGASFIGTSSGGTVQTHLDRYKNVFTPFDFGAKGDGTTDDTEALMEMAAAVNALIDNSHHSYYNELTPLIWLPPGD